ncbi:MAG TPA: ParA family protein [Candidatus Angelobacter sp.]|nr:ParA family protein [Candidatus Angelobacter sp.]
MSMPSIVACVNLKGGVGKTAIAVNFAAYCGRKGMRTLLVDLDPQTNATFSCISVDDWEEHAANNGTVADLFGARAHTSAEGKQKGLSTIVRKKVWKNMDLIPSNVELFTIDLELAGATARETKLRKALAPILANYDMIVCDCPPNLTIPTQNALAVCTHYVVPISPDFLSALGVGLLLSQVKKFCDDMQVDPKLAGMVLSRIGRPAQHRETTANSLREQFGDSVFNAELHERVHVSEAVERNVCIYKHAPNSPAAQEFSVMSEELLGRLAAKEKK